MSAPATIPTVVIGAGHAGLSTSYHLRQRGVEHVVLDAGRIGEAWRSARWDSFTLNTPNWTLRLPGFPYDGPEPDAFMTRDETVRYLKEYCGRHGLEVREGTRVTSLSRASPDGLWRIESTGGTLQARNVVVATGAFHKPRIPASAASVPASIHQIPTHAYRNPAALPPGAVLVVGTGQSGGQIAEDLLDAGRRVFISAGKCPRIIRRYRGKDIMVWLEGTGFFARTPDALASPTAKTACNPLTSGTRGGHDIDLRALAGAGAILLGRFEGVVDGRARFADDLHDILTKADAFCEKMLSDVDAHILRAGLQAPIQAHPPPLPPVKEELSPIREMDLAREGITTVIWATGGQPDHAWIRSFAVPEKGEVMQARGVSPDPGLYFVGLHWQHTSASDIFLGVGADADHVAEHIAKREKMETLTS